MSLQWGVIRASLSAKVKLLRTTHAYLTRVGEATSTMEIEARAGDRERLRRHLHEIQGDLQEALNEITSMLGPE